MKVTVKVKDVMDRNVVSVNSIASVSDAIEKMIKSNVWSLVVQRRGLPEGVVTERDVIRRCIAKGLMPGKTPVAEIESTPLITVSPDATIREAMDLMVSKSIRRLFVVDGGRIIGRVTQTELFENMLGVLESLSSISTQL
ncbi:MAG: CBS domain-containing protein [Nitrososphaerota archaeon]|nr:CBS domain-containing protein [Nitrososphaerota archaeon]